VLLYKSVKGARRDSKQTSNVNEVNPFGRCDHLVIECGPDEGVEVSDVRTGDVALRKTPSNPWGYRLKISKPPWNTTYIVAARIAAAMMMDAPMIQAPRSEGSLMRPMLAGEPVDFWRGRGDRSAHEAAPQPSTSACGVGHAGT
jgi:hypothetical protein